MNPIIEAVTEHQLKTDRNNFKVGDSVEVHTRVREGDKERIQVFKGIVIAIKHGGIQKSFTVRRVVRGFGVERIFPVHSPNIDKIVVDRVSKVMRSKLYYMRGRKGKAASEVKEQA